MKVRNIAQIIECFAPTDTAMSFDNVGLLVGDYEREVTGILICVDVTGQVLEEALDNDCNLIIAHHPLLFTPQKTFLADSYINSIIAKAFVNKINIYAAHTNVDRIKNNMSYRVLKSLGCDKIYGLLDDGIGAIGDLGSPITLDELKDNLEALTADTQEKIVGDKQTEVLCVAMINGAGADSDSLKIALDRGADVLITADIKHHIMLEALELGLPLIEVGHYASEKTFIEIIYEMLLSVADTENIIKHYGNNPYN